MKKLFMLLIAVMAVAVASAQMRTVIGQVLNDSDNEPLVGASVIPQGHIQGVVTDIDGNFKIQVGPDVHILTVAFIGMTPQEVRIPANGKKITVRLSDKENVLDEVLVVAYGTAKKSAFTGSASQVDDAKIAQSVVSDVTSALSGNVSGVQLQSANGQPGVEPTIRIRGVGSINASSNPLIVVDGIPYDGGVSSIAPQDVVSMTVLKDAASAALYGARGANGVILITTKKGQAGQQAKVTFEGRWGVNSRQIPQYNKISSTAEIYTMTYSALNYYAQNTLGYGSNAAHAYANNMLAGSNTSVFGYQIYNVPSGENLIGVDGTLNPNATLGYNDGSNYFTVDDWQKGTYRDGLRQEYNVQVSGGTDNINYLLSSNYLQDEGTIQNSDYKRLSMRANLEVQAKKWLKLGTNSSYSYESMNYPLYQTSSGYSGNAVYLADYIAPIYPMYIRDAEGNILHDSYTGNKLYDYGMNGLGLSYNRNFSVGNPVGDFLYNTSEYLYDVINSKVYAIINPIEGLNITGTLGYWNQNYRYNGLDNDQYGQMSQYGGTIEQDAYRSRSINFQLLANYKTTLAEVHNLDFLAGYESYSWQRTSVGGSGYDIYSTYNVTLSNVSSDYEVWGSKYNYSTRGFFGQVNYNYKGQYYLNANYRRDASSCFAPDKRWGNFWGVSAAWDISKESFMQDFGNIDMLKFKVSYGEQGNDNFGRSASYPYNFYPYMDMYTQSGTDGVWSTGTLYYKGNPDITWETSHSFNTGFDFSFFQGRIDGTLEYFNRQTSNMLYNKSVAPSLGYSSIPVNFGSMRNNGLELELRATPVQTKDIVWDVNLNFTFLKNKVLKLPEEYDGEYISGSTIYREGHSRYELYLVEYAGVNAETGAAQYWALNDDDEEYLTDDYYTAYMTNRKPTGNLMPPVYGGFGTSVRAFGFDASVQFGYQLGGKIIDYGYMYLMHGGNNTGMAMHVDSRKAWSPDNTNTNVPALDYNSNNYVNSISTRWLTSSDFLSLNNVTVGYTFPAKITRKIGINQLRLYCAGENLCIWTKRKGMDPRQSYYQAYAGYYGSLRTVTGGVNISF